MLWEGSTLDPYPLHLPNEKTVVDRNEQVTVYPRERLRRAGIEGN